MKSIIKHSVKSCAINKISQFSSFKILNKIQKLINILKLIQAVLRHVRLEIVPVEVLS